MNANQGIVSVGIFVATLILGWVTGIFSALRRKPNFKLELIDGPTFCCTFPLGKQFNGFDVHRTGIALYLKITNIGSAASSIDNISIGYHWPLRPFSLQWLRYSVGWFWLQEQAVALSDFQARIGENIKIYPFLFQKNFLSPANSTTHLDVGMSTNGVVYFEQVESWGGCFPAVERGRVRILASVRDVFGGVHRREFSIPSVSLEEARKYNPDFGKTFAELDGDTAHP